MTMWSKDDDDYNNDDYNDDDKSQISTTKKKIQQFKIKSHVYTCCWF